MISFPNGPQQDFHREHHRYEFGSCFQVTPSYCTGLANDIATVNTLCGVFPETREVFHLRLASLQERDWRER